MKSCGHLLLIQVPARIHMKTIAMADPKADHSPTFHSGSILPSSVSCPHTSPLTAEER